MEPCIPGTEDEPPIMYNTLTKQENERERLLNQKAFLKNGICIKAFELRIEQGVENWYCNVCNCFVFGPVFPHELGRKHTQNLSFDNRNREDNEKLFDAEMEILPEIAPGEPAPPGFEYLETSTQIQDRLDAFQVESLVALEYLLEVQDNDPMQEPVYVCTLCDKRGDPRTVIPHLAGHNHILEYLKRHFPTTWHHLSRYGSKPYKRNLHRAVQKIAEDIEKKFGRLKPIPVNKYKYEQNKSFYVKLTKNRRHFSENSGYIFKEIIVPDEVIKTNEVEKSSETSTANNWGSISFSLKKRSPSPHIVGILSKKNKCSAKKQEAVGQNDTTTNRLSDQGSRQSRSAAKTNRSRSNSSVSDKSDDDNKSNKNRSESNKNKAKSQVQRNKLHARRRSPSPKRPYKRLSLSPAKKKLRSQSPTYLAEQEKEKLRKFEEFRKLSRAIENDVFNSMQIHEKNPERHPRYSIEWKGFWNRRYAELRAVGIDITTYNWKPEWIEFWNKRLVELHSDDLRNRKEALRKRLCLPEDLNLNKFPDGKIVIQPENVGPKTTAAQQVKNEDVIIVEDTNDGDENYDSVSSTSSENTRKNKGTKSKRRSCSPRPRRRLNRRSKSCDRILSKNRSSPFSKSKGTSRNRDSRSRSCSRSRTDPYWDRDIPVYEEDSEDDVGVVDVLRILIALEDRLGSLGPKVIDLLTQALVMEKKEANSSEKLLDNEMNCMFFETVKEKLKGLLIAGLVDPMQHRAFKKAIRKISLILLTEQKGRQRTKVLLNITPSTSGSVADKTAIAKQIASALIMQRKTDVTQAELEKLIDGVVSTTEASSNPITFAGFSNSLSSDKVIKPSNKINLDKVIKPLTSRPEKYFTNNMGYLSDFHLQSFLQNFKVLSLTEQCNLINYLKNLQNEDPERVNKLRKFVNANTGDKLKEDPKDNTTNDIGEKTATKKIRARRESRFSDWIDDTNANQSININSGKKEEISNKPNFDMNKSNQKFNQDLEDKYTCEDNMTTASKNVKDKEWELQNQVLEETLKCYNMKKNESGAKNVISQLMNNISKNTPLKSTSVDLSRNVPTSNPSISSASKVNVPQAKNLPKMNTPLVSSIRQVNVPTSNPAISRMSKMGVPPARNLSKMNTPPATSIRPVNVPPTGLMSKMNASPANNRPKVNIPLASSIQLGTAPPIRNLPNTPPARNIQPVNVPTSNPPTSRVAKVDAPPARNLSKVNTPPASSMRPENAPTSNRPINRISKMDAPLARNLPKVNTPSASSIRPGNAPPARNLSKVNISPAPIIQPRNAPISNPPVSSMSKVIALPSSNLPKVNTPPTKATRPVNIPSSNSPINRVSNVDASPVSNLPKEDIAPASNISKMGNPPASNVPNENSSKLLNRNMDINSKNKEVEDKSNTSNSDIDQSDKTDNENVKDKEWEHQQQLLEDTIKHYNLKKNDSGAKNVISKIITNITKNTPLKSPSEALSGPENVVSTSNPPVSSVSGIDDPPARNLPKVNTPPVSSIRPENAPTTNPPDVTSDKKEDMNKSDKDVNEPSEEDEYTSKDAMNAVPRNIKDKEWEHQNQVLEQTLKYYSSKSSGGNVKNIISKLMNNITNNSVDNPPSSSMSKVDDSSTRTMPRVENPPLNSSISKVDNPPASSISKVDNPPASSISTINKRPTSSILMVDYPPTSSISRVNNSTVSSISKVNNPPFSGVPQVDVNRSFNKNRTNSTSIVNNMSSSENYKKTLNFKQSLPINQHKLQTNSDSMKQTSRDHFRPLGKGSEVPELKTREPGKSEQVSNKFDLNNPNRPDGYNRFEPADTDRYGVQGPNNYGPAPRGSDKLGLRSTVGPSDLSRFGPRGPDTSEMRHSPLDPQPGGVKRHAPGNFDQIKSRISDELRRLSDLNKPDSEGPDKVDTSGPDKPGIQNKLIRRRDSNFEYENSESFGTDDVDRFRSSGTNKFGPGLGRFGPGGPDKPGIPDKITGRDTSNFDYEILERFGTGDIYRFRFDGPDKFGSGPDRLGIGGSNRFETGSSNRFELDDPDRFRPGGLDKPGIQDKDIFGPSGSNRFELADSDRLRSNFEYLRFSIADIDRFRSGGPDNFGSGPDRFGTGSSNRFEIDDSERFRSGGSNEPGIQDTLIRHGNSDKFGSGGDGFGTGRSNRFELDDLDKFRCGGPDKPRIPDTLRGSGSNIQYEGPKRFDTGGTGSFRSGGPDTFGLGDHGRVPGRIGSGPLNRYVPGDPDRRGYKGPDMFDPDHNLHRLGPVSDSERLRLSGVANNFTSSVSSARLGVDSAPSIFGPGVGSDRLEQDVLNNFRRISSSSFVSAVKGFNNSGIFDSLGPRNGGQLNFVPPHGREGFNKAKVNADEMDFPRMTAADLNRHSGNINR